MILTPGCLLGFPSCRSFHSDDFLQSLIYVDEIFSRFLLNTEFGELNDFPNRGNISKNFFKRYKADNFSDSEYY